MQSSIFQEFQLKYQMQQVSFKASKHPSKALFNLWENIKQADFIVRFRWRKAMSCKNAALCSAEHAESISGLSIERGRRGGGGWWLENSWARHLSFFVPLRRLMLAHTEVTATASDTFWHLLLVAGFHDKHPRGPSTFTSDTNAWPSLLLQPPPVSRLSYFWPQLITLTTTTKKSQSQYFITRVQQTHADALLVCFPLKYWFRSHSRAIWSMECVLQTLTHSHTYVTRPSSKRNLLSKLATKHNKHVEYSV